MNLNQLTQKQKIIAVGLGFLLLVAAIFGIYFGFIKKDTPTTPKPPSTPTSTPKPPSTPTSTPTPTSKPPPSAINMADALKTNSDSGTIIDSVTNLVFPNRSTSYLYHTGYPITIANVDITPQFLRRGIGVPASAFDRNAQYEYFIAGSFKDLSPKDISNLILSLTFKNSVDTNLSKEDTFCDAIISSGESISSNQMFNARTIFIINALTDTNIEITQSTISFCDGTQNSKIVNNSETKTVITPNRLSEPVFYPRLVVWATGGPVSCTFYNWYLRRVA